VSSSIDAEPAVDPDYLVDFAAGRDAADARSGVDRERAASRDEPVGSLSIAGSAVVNTGSATTQR
jgi:hypothetical protein